MISASAPFVLRAILRVGPWCLARGRLSNRCFPREGLTFEFVDKVAYETLPGRIIDVCTSHFFRWDAMAYAMYTFVSLADSFVKGRTLKEFLDQKGLDKSEPRSSFHYGRLSMSEADDFLQYLFWYTSGWPG